MAKLYNKVTFPCPFTIEKTYYLSNRGIGLFPGVIIQKSDCIRPGETILLKKSDGTKIESKIYATENLDPTPKGEVLIWCKYLNEEDVPKGTEVWSIK
jgi:hypothetical protein